MKILLFGECPWVPSSAGKITYLLARGMIEMGHDVLVVCAGTGRPFTRFTVFNPRRWGTKTVLAPYYPDIDIPVGPARVGNLMRVSLEYFNSRPDIIVAYGTSFGDVLGQFNNEIGASGVPSILYVTNDLVNLNPSLAASVLSHTYVVGPTKASLDEIVKSLRIYYSNVDDVLDRFSVAYHGIDIELYNPRTCRELCLERDDDLVIGMFAKNHVRKDYQALALAVAKLVKDGFNVHLGMFSVRGISAPVWVVEHVNEQVEIYEGISFIDSGRLKTLDPFDDVEGVPEDVVVKLYCSVIDVHAFLTRGESFGLPPIESLAFGVPTISTDVPPQREILSDGGEPVIPLVKAFPDKQMHPGLHIIDVDDAYMKLRAVVEGMYDYTHAYTFVRRYNYRRMCSDLLSIARTNAAPPLYKVLRKRSKVLSKYLPGMVE